MVNEQNPVTLAEDVMYADLAQAHDEGVDNKGRTEEELYPAKQAVADNTEHYGNEVDKLGYVFEADRFKNKRLEEAQDRLGKDSKELQDVQEQLERVFVKLQQQNAEMFKQTIAGKTYYFELGRVLEDIERSVAGGRITSEQAVELRTAIDVKGAEIQQKNADAFKQIIAGKTYYFELGRVLEDIERSVAGGRITSEQAVELRTAIDVKGAEIQQKNADAFKRAIESSKSQEEIDELLIDIDRSAEKNRITEELRDDLRKQALNRRQAFLPSLKKL